MQSDTAGRMISTGLQGHLRARDRSSNILVASVGTVGTEEVVTRLFRADPAEFIVRCPTAEIRDVVEASFLDLPRGDGSRPATMIDVRQHGPHLSVCVEGEPRSALQRPNDALGSVVASVTRAALDADPGRLHVHCAAVAREGRGVLISARSGTGKTTLTAALLARGWSYSSDESVALDADGPSVSAFPKPLMIKDPRAADLVPALAKAGLRLEPDETSVATVPASRLGAPVELSVNPHVVVILTREHDDNNVAPERCRPIHPTDAVVALMRETMDAGRFGPGAVEVLGALAATSHCVHITVGPLDAAAENLEELTRSDEKQHEWHVLQPDNATATLPWHVPAHVRSVVIGDRCAIHDPSGGAVLALDEAGTALWRALHGDPVVGWTDEVLFAPGTQRFFEALSRYGLLVLRGSTAEIIQ